MAQDRFDETIAAGYDTVWPELSDPAVVDPAVDVLATLAEDGAALELGIGTGRLALPLAARGVPVTGIELSPAMVERLRAKPGGDAIPVVIGDFATTSVDGEFSLVYLVCNTIMNLTTQDEQVECFRRAASHLEPRGCFLIEVIVPSLQRLPPGETVQVFAASPAYVGFDVFVDLTEQRSDSHHWWATADGVRTFSAPFRYVWPSELDLMARLAGLRRRERWADWDRSPFTGGSRSHVSVWEKP